MDYLPKRQTINKQYYANQLEKLHGNIKVKRRGKLTKGVSFFVNIVPVHRLHLVRDFGTKLIEHSP